MLKAGVVLVNRYEIVGRIGSGGMADVYKAMDHKLNRFVAIKVMKPEFKSDSTFISKFRREAQAAAGLANPNIVNVYDVGEDQGYYYIVMELVEGITLKEYIAKKGKLSVREATSIAIQVCMGLSAAHDQGIVHRDVKPQNIIISTDGKVKVTDFGIARAASTNTISANAMGSVHYSSPEQVRGGYSDARSDIYSLGITLYEMVTGRVPFDGETTVAIAIKHLQDELEPPTKYTPDLPFALQQIIYKCTQKSVDRRYQTMNEVIMDLKRSLMEPNGQFVQIASLEEHARTVMVTPAEQAAIRAANGQGTAPPREQGPHPVPTYSSIDNARRGREERFDEDQDVPSEDDDRDVSTGLEKAVTIGSFIVCGLIICILIYFIAKAAGLFGGRNSAAGNTVTSAETVSQDDGTVKAPLIVGMTESEAQEAAAAVGVGIKFESEEVSDEEAGIIIRQNPEAGAPVEKNSTIRYTRSSGPQIYTVPQVVNLSQTEAMAALTRVGFTKVVARTQPSADIPAGTVIAVTPEEGQKASASDEITLTVSSGNGEVPDDGTGEIPDVTEQPEGQPTEETAGQDSGGVWVARANLGQPSNYTGGAWRMALYQEVNGSTSETVIAEGGAGSLTFPYYLETTGASGVGYGTVYLYELDASGDYVARVTWDVPFAEQ